MSAEIEQPAEKERADGKRADLRSEATLFSPSRLWDARDKDDLAVADSALLSKILKAARSQSSKPRSSANGSLSSVGVSAFSA
jgi:hypothetical protein